MKFEMKQKHWLAMSVILIATAAYRIFPHPQNIAPMAGLALLGSAYIKESWKAWLLPIGAFWISDLILNNIVYAQYFDGFVWASQPFLFSAAAIFFIVMMGKVLLKKVKVGNVILASLLASIVFFLVSNFGVWAQGILYPKDLTGLMAAYAAGIPFFQEGTILGDLLFTGVFFGAWHLMFRNEIKPIAAEQA
jgi:hypothetical protein